MLRICLSGPPKRRAGTLCAIFSEHLERMETATSVPPQKHEKGDL
jgi:hypothetical protein